MGDSTAPCFKPTAKSDIQSGLYRTSRMISLFMPFKMSRIVPSIPVLTFSQKPFYYLVSKQLQMSTKLKSSRFIYKQLFRKRNVRLRWSDFFKNQTVQLRMYGFAQKIQF